MKQKTKKILIGVSSSISVYKTCDLIRNLTKSNFSITIIMTKNAQNFIGKTTFEALTENKVYIDEFEYGMPHIELRKNTALLAIVPASANIIGKCANGISDDLLSSTYLSSDFPVIFAPAMNPFMYQKKVVQRNIKQLQKDGAVILLPQKGKTICGDTGIGKLAKVAEITKAIIEQYDKV